MGVLLDYKSWKKIFESQVGVEMDFVKDPAWKKLVEQALSKTQGNSTTPINVKQYIFVPTTAQDSLIQGTVTAFVMGRFGLPALAPITDSTGLFKFDTVLENGYCMPSVFGEERMEAYAKQINADFAKIPVAVLKAAYPVDPEIAAFNTAVESFKKNMIIAGKNEMQYVKFLSQPLKEFFGLVQTQAAPPAQPTTVVKPGAVKN
jgi:hypothetical protein